MRQSYSHTTARHPTSETVGGESSDRTIEPRTAGPPGPSTAEQRETHHAAEAGHFGTARPQPSVDLADSVDRQDDGVSARVRHGVGRFDGRLTFSTRWP